MGGDGGTQCVRRDLIVQTAKRAAVVDPSITLDALWNHCHLTANPLREPVVACELGGLYNKDAILEHRLNKLSGVEISAERDAKVKHIRGLKDVVELKLTKTPGFDPLKGSDPADTAAAQFCCPVLSDVEMNGRHSFLYYRNCGGCVVSEAAFKEAPSKTCLVCDAPYEEGDVIPLCPDADTVVHLRAAMNERRLAAKAAAKAKKRAAKAAARLMPAPAAPGVARAATSEKVVGGAAVASSGAGRAGKGKDCGKRTAHAAELNAPVAKVARGPRQTIRIGTSELNAIKAIPNQVADDGRASQAFKSLFTSSLKDPKKNEQNASIGAYTARTTFARF